MSRRRIRSLKPEFFEDEHVCSISRDARLVAIGLITLADDRGRMHHRPRAILSDLFPEEAVTGRQMTGWMGEILKIKVALAYKVEEFAYLWLPHFLRHQVINKPTESVLPAHPEDPFASMPIKQALQAAKRPEADGSATGSIPEFSRSAPVVLPPHARFPSDPIPSSSEKSSVARELVDEACAILTAIDPSPDPALVENAAAMYPAADLLQGCRLSVMWASAPTWTLPWAATLRAALRKLEAEKPQESAKQARKARDAEVLGRALRPVS